jgi:phenylpropionate dioxygenase-like ring-hydroxylating dioxygenase large terminal subunit
MDPLEAVRHSYDGGRPLPGAAYRDAGIFEIEVSKLFRETWVSIACGQNVPERGDLFPVRIAGQSLLVLRDTEDAVRVFYNLCRHRGAPLADAPCRVRGERLVCPYHAWSYGLDGQLVAAPHFHREEHRHEHRGQHQGEDAGQPSAQERAGLGLLPVRSAVWRDIVFVNFSGEAPPFEDFIRPLDQHIARWTEAELQPLSSDEYEIHANWKLAAENFLDVYHLPVVHPEIGGGFSGALRSEDVEVSDEIVGVVLPDGYGEGSGQQDWLLPRFSGLGADEQLRIEVFSLFPNTLILVEPDSQQVIVLRPQTPGVTLETFANYIVSDESQSEELAKERDEMYQSAIQVNDQDAALLAGLQLTRAMDVGASTQLSQAWDRTHQRFQRIWARKLLASSKV